LAGADCLVISHWGDGRWARGVSTKSANHKLGQPRGVALCDKDEQVVGFRGALLGYFLGKQKVTETNTQRRESHWDQRPAQGKQAQGGTAAVAVLGAVSGKTDAADQTLRLIAIGPAEGGALRLVQGGADLNSFKLVLHQIRVDLQNRFNPCSFQG
jgi:hypothetical protein